MKGIISHIKKYRGCYFFVLGEDGVEYFTKSDWMADKKQYDKYCWQGNGVTFDIVPDPLREGKRVAKNVVPDNVPDPEYSLKRKLSREAKGNREKNAQKKAAYARKRELIEAENERYKAIMGDHLRYILQQFTDHEWREYKPDGKRVLYKSNREAKDAAKRLKEELHGMWRPQKVIV